MTYQKPPTPKHDDDDDTVEEASSLLFGQGRGEGGVPARTKTHGVPTMRAMIVTTCFFLGTLAMISGSRGSSTDSSGDLSADLLRGGHTQAVPSDGISLEVYDPSSDYCFKDHETPGKYCWHSNNNLPCEEDGTGDGTDWRAEVWSWWYTDCGQKCTKILQKRVGAGYRCVSV